MNTRKLIAVSFLAAAVFALGCAADDGGLEELDENRALWESHGIADYTMEVDGIDGAPTVTSLFGHIENAIQQGDVIEVEYDDTLGFPTRAVGGLFDFEVTHLEFDVIESPGGDVIVPPPPTAPVLPPQVPGFDEFVDDPVLDQPQADVVVKDLDGFDRTFIPKYTVIGD